VRDYFVPSVGEMVDVINEPGRFEPEDERLTTTFEVLAVFVNCEDQTIVAMQDAHGKCQCILSRLLRPAKTQEQNQATAEWLSKVSYEYSEEAAEECEQILKIAGYRSTFK